MHYQFKNGEPMLKDGRRLKPFWRKVWFSLIAITLVAFFGAIGNVEYKEQVFQEKFDKENKMKVVAHIYAQERIKGFEQAVKDGKVKGLEHKKGIVISE